MTQLLSDEDLDRVNGVASPLGGLTGDVYRALRRCRAAGDERGAAILLWVHERVCLARYQIRGEEWPSHRPIPLAPHAQHSGEAVEQLISKGANDD